jgi:hypothetical protein
LSQFCFEPAITRPLAALIDAEIVRLGTMTIPPSVLYRASFPTRAPA